MSDNDLVPNNALGPIDVSAQTVFDSVKTIIKAGHEEQFLAMCAQKNYRLVIPSEIINAVKGYLLDNDVHKGQEAWNLMARDVIISSRGRCP